MKNLKHNHVTRDFRFWDCPKCKIQWLEDQVLELQMVADDWMNEYQKLKDKYEPEVMVMSEKSVLK